MELPAPPLKRCKTMPRFRTLGELADDCEEGRKAVDAMSDDEKVMFSIIEDEGETALLVNGTFVKKHADIFCCVFEPRSPEEDENIVKEEWKAVRVAVLKILTCWYDLDVEDGKERDLKEGVTSVRCSRSIVAFDLKKENVVKLVQFRDNFFSC